MRRFIVNYAAIAKPLYQLLEKDNNFLWGTAHKEAFQELTVALTSKPVLAIFNPKLQCVLYTDASGVGIGAILAQVGEDSKEHPMGYFSKTLRKQQHNFHAAEFEGLAVVSALEHFDCYLYEQPFTILTDHSALQYILQHKNPNKRQFNWSLYISTYNAFIEHRSGKKMTHVDALSRNSLCLHLTVKELIQIQSTEDISDIDKQSIRNGIVTTKINNRHLAVIPKTHVQQILENVHDKSGHPGINKTVQQTTASYWWPNCQNNIKQYVRSCKTCQLVKLSHQPFPRQYITPETNIRLKDILVLTP